MSVVSTASPPTASSPPLLVGARARSGVTALEARLRDVGTPVRVFGHPARVPANRDALAAALVTVAAGALGWAVPSVGRPAALVAALIAVALRYGGGGWPRAAAWTLIVGEPVRRPIRRIVALALDVRRPHEWAFSVILAFSLLGLIVPGTPLPLACAALGVALTVWDPVRARPVGIDAAEAWVRQHVGAPDTLVLVSTATSGYGEGVLAVIDWFKLDRAAITVEVDEEGDSGVRRRLSRQGVGPQEAPRDLAGSRVRG